MADINHSNASTYNTTHKSSLSPYVVVFLPHVCMGGREGGLILTANSHHNYVQSSSFPHVWSPSQTAEAVARRNLGRSQLPQLPQPGTRSISLFVWSISSSSDHNFWYYVWTKSCDAIRVYLNRWWRVASSHWLNMLGYEWAQVRRHHYKSLFSNKSCILCM